MKPLFHPTTGAQVATFINKPGHALLLSGPEGAGKGTVASYLAAQMLHIEPAVLSNHPYTLWIHDQPAIGIEDVRAMQKLTQLKVPGNGSYKRCIIIEHAENLGGEAQNALLKLLEEPPADTILILTTNHQGQLLPTITSRTQHIKILPLELAILKDNFSSQFTDTQITKAFYLSEGYIGLMQALLTQDTSHPLVEQIDAAKRVLGASTFERLISIDEITKNKTTALLLEALERVCHAALTQAALKESAQLAAWRNRLKVIVQARTSLNSTPNQKLLLTDLFLSL